MTDVGPLSAPRVCVLLAEGFEEIEAVTLLDVLRRAGLQVVSLGVTGLDVTGSHGIRVRADRALAGADTTSWDLVVLPGGMPGAAHLRDDARVQELLRAHGAAGGRVAAICAAPIALARAGLLEGRTATCYPGFESQLAGARVSNQRVVTDGSVLTSQGPGTALLFALRLVAALLGEQAARDLAGRLLVDVGDRSDGPNPAGSAAR